jgi:DNA-binding protein H-NS
MPTEAEMTGLYATLDRMEADELRQVQKRVEAMISDYQDRKRREAIAAAEQVAKEHGFKLTELVGGGKPERGTKAATAKSSAPAKYRNSDDPQQTWSGLGRRPTWVRLALDAGRTLDDLAV